MEQNSPETAEPIVPEVSKPAALESVPDQPTKRGGRISRILNKLFIKQKPSATEIGLAEGNVAKLKVFRRHKSDKIDS